MSFLSRIIRRTPPPVRVTVSPTFGDPDAIAITIAMVNGDWPAVRAVLDAEHHQEDFDFLVDAAISAAGSQEWLPDKIREDGDDRLASLLYGCRLIEWAWEARTGYAARYVTADRWALFRERLQQAEEVLQDVVRRHPADVTAWTHLITVGRGLSRPLSEQRERFARATEADPLNLSAHRQFLQGTCAKWQGSDTLMHEFAETAAANAPAGSRLALLPVLAHWERWLSEVQDGRDGYFARNRAVAADVVAAAERSVLHPAYEPRRNVKADHNQFAAAFAQSRDWPRARHHFAILQGQATELPWGWMADDPATGYLRMYYRAHTT